MLVEGRRSQRKRSKVGKINKRKQQPEGKEQEEGK
jgi:hypothetical protein